MLAYGPTGTGKTYTMGTSGANGSNQCPGGGVIPRTMARLYELVDGCQGEPRPTPAAHRLSSAGARKSSPILSPPASRRPDKLARPPAHHPADTAEVSCRVSFVEIFKEDIRDLLADPLDQSRPDVTIRETVAGGVCLAGAVEHEVASQEEMAAVLARGANSRATASTNMNAHSSRSHAIFTIHVEKRPLNGGARPLAAPPARSDVTASRHTRAPARELRLLSLRRTPGPQASARPPRCTSSTSRAPSARSAPAPRAPASRREAPRSPLPSPHHPPPRPPPAPA